MVSLFVPAYNAEKTLEGVVNRIPADLWPRIGSVFIINDGSRDDTGRRAALLASRNPKVRVVDFPANRGYGAVVKTGLSFIREEGSDWAVCLHGDGQYPPEKIPELIKKGEEGADLIQGSRHAAGTAREGGMPLYKWVAGKGLVALENRVFGLSMTDYHSGFLVYGRKVLEQVNFDRLSGSFDIDLEIIASARAAGLRVAEIPIPTKYGDEDSHLNPVTYGLRTLKVMGKYVLGKYHG